MLMNLWMKNGKINYFYQSVKLTLYPLEWHLINLLMGIKLTHLLHLLLQRPKRLLHKLMLLLIQMVHNINGLFLLLDFLLESFQLLDFPLDFLLFHSHAYLIQLLLLFVFTTTGFGEGSL